jgi:hypothetical protein
MNAESKKPWGDKIAVAVIHGAGAQGANFADKLKAAIKEDFSNLVKGVDVDSCLKFMPVHWAPIMQVPEDELWRKMTKFDFPWKPLRKFVVSNAADAFAYQPSPKEKTVYEKIHAEMARSLSTLAQKAGENAPLCVIGHSLGTVIASNYFYDISYCLTPPKVGKYIRDNSLEQGKTLVLFYTMGCPIALWGVRFANFGKPIRVPAKEVANFYPPVEGGWINLYERHDVFSFPLRPLNDEYKAMVRDCSVRIGKCISLISHLFPTCHEDYWTSRGVAACIAEGLAQVWCEINNQPFIPPKRRCSFFCDKKCYQ